MALVYVKTNAISFARRKTAMVHKGLNKEAVVKAAMKIIEENGYENFSMRLLADKLGVKTASLYNHVSSMEELYTEIGLHALMLLKQMQLDSIGGRQKDDAVYALAESYRRFAKEHRELYKVIMGIPKVPNAILEEAAAQIIDPIMQVLSEYDIEKSAGMHWQRVLRSIMHGFISQEDAGYFSHFDVNTDESYRVAIRCFLDGLHADGQKRRHDKQEREIYNG